MLPLFATEQVFSSSGISNKSYSCVIFFSLENRTLYCCEGVEVWGFKIIRSVATNPVLAEVFDRVEKDVLLLWKGSFFLKC